MPGRLRPKTQPGWTREKRKRVSDGRVDMNDESSKTTWPEFAIVLFDLLTGRKAEVTYEFENFEIFVPLASGAGPDHAIWKLNGALKIRAREEIPG